MDKQQKQETTEQQKIKQLENEKNELKKMYEQKLKQYAVQFALQQAGGRNTKALLALVDLENITLKEDGTIEGLDIKQLKKEVPYLFFEEENKKSNKIEGTGYNSSNRIQKNQAAIQFQSALMRR